MTYRTPRTRTQVVGESPTIRLLLLRGGPEATHDYVEEAEQVRRALDLDSTGFLALGHWWREILGIEYALKYGHYLTGLIISSMASDDPGDGRVLTDEMWARIEPLVPDRTPRLGGQWRDHREVLEAIIRKFRTGSPWPDLPPTSLPGRRCGGGATTGPRTAPGTRS